MEKHQKIDRVVLTICAYVFGALVARQLAPETIHTSLAGEPDKTAVAQASAVTSLPAGERKAPVTDIIANQAVADEFFADPPLSNRSGVAPKSELKLAESDESVEVSQGIDSDAKPQVVSVDEPAGDVASSQEADVNSEDDTTAQDGLSVEDHVAVEDHAADEDHVADEVNLTDKVNVADENDRASENALADGDALAPEDDLAIEPAQGREAAAPVIAVAEPVGEGNCPGAPVGEAEPAGVEPTDIFADEATAGTQSDAGRRAEKVTGSPAPSANPNATPELTPELLALERKIRQALNIYRHRNLNTAQHSAWSIMHSLISFGVEKELFIQGPGGQRVNAIGWICFNGLCRGENLFYLKNGRIQGRLGPGRQGHNGQFLAMLAQSRVKIDYPMRVEGKKFTIADLVRAEQETCRPKSELTFKLIGLSHYLDIDETWKSEDGQSWTIDRMVGEEIRQPIIGAACGGTHRLFGLAYAVDRRRRSGRPIDGNFRRAQVYLNDYHDYVFRLQNRDGSFSTNWFSGRGGEMDLDRRLDTTGHTAEWLSFSLPDEQLLRPAMVKSVNYLADLLIDGQNRDWKIGPQGHGLHALNLYHRRVFSASAGQAIESLTDAQQRRRGS